MTRSVIVVGAGIAGLTAAYKLQQQGFQVRVLESGEHVGGRMSHRQAGPIAYNTGARLLYPFGKALHALIDELGLTPDLVPLKHLHALCRDGDKTYRIDLMPGLGALRTPGLTWRDKAGLLRAAVHLAWLRRQSNPDDALSALAYDNETLADYIRRVAGPNVLARLVDPVFRGTRSWDPESISAAFYLSTTPSLLGEDTVYVLRGGMGQVTTRLAERLQVTCDAHVTAILRPSEGECRVRYTQAGVEHEMAADIVVCAVQGVYARAMIATPCREEQKMLSAVRYNSLGIVHYALRGTLPPTLEFAMKRSPTRISTWQLSAAPDVDGEARTVLYCQLTPEAVQEAIDLSCTDNVDRLIRDEIRSRIPDFDDRVAFQFNQWIACKLPVFYTGYGQQVADFLQWQNEAPRQVYFCGDYLAQSLLNGACHSATTVVQAIGRHG